MKAVKVEREPVPGPGYMPAKMAHADFPRLDAVRLEELAAMNSLTPVVADALDQLGWQLTVPGSILSRRSGVGTVVGHAVTVAYLPERSVMHGPDRFPRPSRLAHRHLFSTADPGDVAVFDARGEAGVSVMGGLAAAEAATVGIKAAVIDGAVRDLEEIRSVGLSVWSRGVTPITGKWRLEAVAINGTVSCGGVQVQPGDLVIADDCGLCFVPYQLLEDVVAIVREIVAYEIASGHSKAQSPAPSPPFGRT